MLAAARPSLRAPWPGFDPARSPASSQEVLLELLLPCLRINQKKDPLPLNTAASPNPTEPEIQALIALIELEQPITTPNNCHYAFHPGTLAEAQAYFHLSPLPLDAAFLSLRQRGLVVAGTSDPGYTLTLRGAQEATCLRRARPPIFYWYCDFYARTRTSPTNAAYCRRVFGADLCQDGFMDMAALEQLLEVTTIRAGERVLDLGCGSGGMAAYVAERSGAHVSGLDYIPEAIRQARELAHPHLDFTVGNMDEIPYPPASFDVILAVDTLYMPNDLAGTLRQLRGTLRPGGRLGAYYSFALWEDLAAGQENLLPERTPLGLALAEAGFSFRAWDVTAEDEAHARRKLEVMNDLRAAFEREGNAFLVENRLGAAHGVLDAIASGTHARYLYLAWR
jgi:SAM-dependent methyltransferase